LLTATPEKLGKETPFAQLSLLDADRFYSFEQFLAKQREFEPIARLAEKIVNITSIHIKHECDDIFQF
jgi:ATP-dependent helicase HepA